MPTFKQQFYCMLGVTGIYYEYGLFLKMLPIVFQLAILFTNVVLLNGMESIDNMHTKFY